MNNSGGVKRFYPTSYEKRYYIRITSRLKKLLNRFKALLKGIKNPSLASIDSEYSKHEHAYINDKMCIDFGISVGNNYDRMFGYTVEAIDPKKIKMLFSNKPLTELVEKWAFENVQLIRDMEAQIYTKFQKIVSQAYVESWDNKYLKEELLRVGDLSMSRAKLIARDQVASLNGQVAKERQQLLGIKKYRWSSSRDERVRPLHNDYDGNIYYWDDPPEDGHPGQAINCRCVAIPIFEDEIV